MLWEPHDPADQLARRFGFKSGASVADWVGEALGRHWALDVNGCHRVVISSWNALAFIEADNKQLIAKWSAVPQRFTRLKDAATVVAWIESCGIPVAAAIPTTDGHLTVELSNPARGAVRSRLPLPGSRFLLSVVPVIVGDLLDISDADHVTEAGRMLAALHEALASYPNSVAGGRPKGREQLVHN